MSYLDDRQRIVASCKSTPGLQDRLHSQINNGYSLDYIVTGVECVVSNIIYDTEEIYRVNFKIQLPNRGNDWFVTALTTGNDVISVLKEKLAADVCDVWGEVYGLLGATTHFYFCLGFYYPGQPNAVTLDELINFVSFKFEDWDGNTVPSTQYSIELKGFSPSASPLATPTNLSATNITSSGATVSWTGDENATSYKVEYRRQGDTTWNE